MAEPNLTDVFGTGASQDETTLTISKADLASTGLVADANNTAESLLSAILLLAQAALTDEGFNSNLDQSVSVTNGFDAVVQRANAEGEFQTYFQRPISVNFHKLADTAIDPNDY